jgi:hypothetical protein
MRKLTSLLIIISLLLICSDHALAQSKVIRKTIKKVVTPEIAPTPPPETTSTKEANPILPPPPPPPPITEVDTLKEEPGLFGWGINTDLNGSYLINRTGQQGLLGVLAVGGDIIFDDPLAIGSRIGLAEDAVEYKAGLGLAFGNDINNNPIFSLGLSTDAVLYLKEGSLFGLDPFVGAGLNLNLVGTDSKIGGLGGQLYGGILADLGLGAGKTGFSIGYNSIKVADSRLAEGLFFSVTQPIKL